MKLRTTILGRLELLGILPERASFEIGIVIGDIRKKLTPTQDEVVKTELKSLPDGRLQINPAKDKEREIEFTDAEANILRGALEQASKNNTLPVSENMMKIYRDVVVNEKPKEQPKKK